MFNVSDWKGPVAVQLPDGKYENVLDGGNVSVSERAVEMTDGAIILLAPAGLPLRRYESKLLTGSLNSGQSV